MDAVISAATRLFSEKSPSRVSIRDIAAAAGVNHGLIHRHFGSKSNLISAVIANIDNEIRQESMKGESFTDSFRLASLTAFRDPSVWRVPARLIMDGERALLNDNSSSYLKELRAAARKQFRDTGFNGLSADESIFMLFALSLGLEMFGDYISEAMDIEKPDNEVLLQKILNILPN